jgi:small basic protein (TIGR04137 family)
MASSCVLETHRASTLTHADASLSFRPSQSEIAMSRHASLKISGLGVKKRSVLKRQERIAQLTIERRWKQGDAVTGLPKTRVTK